MKNSSLTILLTATLAASLPLSSGVALAKEVKPTAPGQHASKGLVSGITLDNIDASVRVQDDFYQHANGAWLAKTEIPAEKARWGSFNELIDSVQPKLREIIEATVKHSANDEQKKVAALYQSFINIAQRDRLGVKPLAADWARINAIKDKRELPALFGALNQLRVKTPLALFINQDARDATQYAVYVSQSGLGLPDRDYYLKDDDAKLKAAREGYRNMIENMLTKAGEADAAASANAIVALETELARAQWTRVENRNPVKTYNKTELAKLAELTPGYDWTAHLASADLQGKVSFVIVRQPSYLEALGKLVETTPLNTWQAYLRWQLLDHYAPFLSQDLVADNFAFYGTVLRGVPTDEPLWKRAVQIVESELGEAVGKLYVAKHFPPQNKARMEKLVANLLLAYKQSIDTLDWMSPATKKEAHAKLATFVPKIGYPNKWRDYTRLNLKADDLVGNLARSTRFEYRRNIDKLGKPIDRAEWGVTPQTVNAYYNPLRNEIVFPAGILQPPFFNAAADDAVNYGGIGAVIGHEISHGFDDQGSQYDGMGNLRNWWMAEDREKFTAKTKVLVSQYAGYSPVPGYPVNGELTLGENIADNSGLAIAYKAYKLSLAGKPSTTIDGLTGEQRLFFGWAQVWRAKSREQDLIVRIKSDTHSPAPFRGNGTVKNLPGFYDAFNVKEGDKMYLPPEQRVSIW